MTKATGATFAVHFRRRREGRTDYNKRLAHLKSGKTRLIVRRTNRYVVVAFADFDLKGDKVLATRSSKSLLKMGYPGKCNTPSAYLTGLLCGKEALQKGVKEAVLDIGRHTATKGGLIFAAMKGAADAGVNVPFSDSILPGNDRIEGKHLKGDFAEKFQECKSKILGSK
ncbi:MAG TPA: 50S ribosomal protein L18 [Candidatus Norongarragalinales archaeon]|nr:50S ribosomal protein L18 [Candidatus Norongarragalinales archaeon]